MDLYMMMCEYEQFYEMKFGRPPKFTVKKSGTEGIEGSINFISITAY